jgi:hypothetical protein
LPAIGPAVRPGDSVHRYAPVVYGRDTAALGNLYQNAITDTPLIAWHETAPAATAGHTVVTYQPLHFTGRYEGDHALLETCTSNNNMCDVVDDPMRFFLSALQTRPADQAREYQMDVNTWTYQILAKEMIREGKIEPPSPVTALTPDASDQRNYLYAVVKKTTQGANVLDPGTPSAVLWHR